MDKFGDVIETIKAWFKKVKEKVMKPKPKINVTRINPRETFQEPLQADLLREPVGRINIKTINRHLRTPRRMRSGIVLHGVTQPRICPGCRTQNSFEENLISGNSYWKCTRCNHMIPKDDN